MPPRKPVLYTSAMRDRVGSAGAVAHKLKQPLAVAWGYLELILDDTATLDPTALRYLREIQLALQSMDDLVNRLQDRDHLGGPEPLDLQDLPRAA